MRIDCYYLSDKAVPIPNEIHHNKTQKRLGLLKLVVIFHLIPCMRQVKDGTVSRRWVFCALQCNDVVTAWTWLGRVHKFLRLKVCLQGLPDLKLWSQILDKRGSSTGKRIIEPGAPSASWALQSLVCLRHKAFFQHFIQNVLIDIKRPKHKAVQTSGAPV